MKLEKYEYSKASTITLRDVPNSVLMGAAELTDRFHHEEMIELCNLTGMEDNYNRLIEIVSHLLTYNPEMEYRKALENLTSDLKELEGENLVKKLAEIKEKQSAKMEYLKSIHSIYMDFWHMVRNMTVAINENGIYVYNFSVYDLEKANKKFGDRKLIITSDVVAFANGSETTTIYKDKDNIELHNTALNYISQYSDGNVGI